MSSNFQEELNMAFDSLKKNIEKPNILLVGGTGVGKSSLLNLCFGEDIAATGVGKPITQHINKFTSPNIPIVLFDSKGYEIGSEQESLFQKEVIELCSETQNSIEDKPHLVWYCIQTIGSWLCFQMYALLLLQLMDHRKQVTRLGIPFRPEHPYETHARLLLL